MRPVFLLLLLVLGSSFLYSQTTLTLDTYPRPVDFIDSMRIVADPGIPFPTGGADVSWDYSFLGAGTLHTDTYYDATSDTAFSDALNYLPSDIDLVLGGLSFTIPSNLYEGLDAEGWYRTGRSLGSQTVSLTPLTGAPNDRIDYPANNVDYVGRLNILQFPMNYEDQWTGSYYFDLNYEVTIGAYGLNQTPAFTRTHYRNEREVVGYGSLVLPTPSGESTAPVEVLMTKVIDTAIDSFFLAGEPAPLPLLNAFGLVQGITDVDSFYVFYTQNFGAPIALFEFPINGQVSRVVFRPQAAALSTSTSDLNIPEFRCFPNPVQAGSKLTIETQELLEEGTVQLFNTGGQYIAQIPYQTAGTSTLEVKLPENLPEQLVFYRVINQQGQAVGRGKILIQ